MFIACLFLVFGHKLTPGKCVLPNTLLKYTRPVLGSWLNTKVHAFVGLGSFCHLSRCIGLFLSLKGL